MATLKAYEFDRLLAKPATHPACVLLYGLDDGVIASRTKALLHHWAKAQSAGAEIIAIDADAALNTSDALPNALNSNSLFGETTLVQIHVGAKNITPALEAHYHPKQHFLLLLAGDLKPNHALRKYCEAHAHIIAVPCYAENEKDIARVMQTKLRAEGLSCDSDTQALLLEFLSANPQTYVMELEKLCLYAHGNARIRQDDILAILPDLSTYTIDACIEAAVAGQSAKAQSLAASILEDDMHPSVIALMFLRHILLLLKINAHKATGEQMDAIFRAIQPPIYPKRQTTISQQLRNVSRETLIALEEHAVKALRDTRDKPTQANAALTLLFERIKQCLNGG